MVPKPIIIAPPSARLELSLETTRGVAAAVTVLVMIKGRTLRLLTQN